MVKRSTVSLVLTQKHPMYFNVQWDFSMLEMCLLIPDWHACQEYYCVETSSLFFTAMFTFFPLFGFNVNYEFFLLIAVQRRFSEQRELQNLCKANAATWSVHISVQGAWTGGHCIHSGWSSAFNDTSPHTKQWDFNILQPLPSNLNELWGLYTIHPVRTEHKQRTLLLLYLVFY